VLAHVHTKKSLYTGSEQSAWRRHLLEALFGSQARVAQHLGLLQAEPRIGILYPESFPGVPGWGHTWLSNFEACRELGQRLGFAIEAGRHIDFPAGSMFWARVDALRPLYALGLRLDDFPEEHGQTDGTLQHAVERMLVALVRQQGMLAAIIPANPADPPSTEGLRNWSRDLAEPLATRLRVAAIDAEQVSVDIFDTLVLRPFLTPQGARHYLAHRASQQLHVTDFAQLRERAEAKARAQAHGDVSLETIYAAMASLGDARKLPITALKQLELELEKQLLRPRSSVLEALAKVPLQRPLIALSDMYLDTQNLHAVLPAAVTAVPGHWRISCETGMRKEQDQLWTGLSAEFGIARKNWLHIGDNEHADIQLPQRHHYATPVQVPRPASLLDMHPALRPLRPPRFDHASWHDQLWLGLVANQFAEAFDRAPQQWLPRPTLSPTLAGYAVLGPLLVDYLSWLARCADARGATTLLLLSREGHLLTQAFTRMQQAAPALARLQGHYLPTSRRASGTASLRCADDLPRLLSGTYNGTLAGLLQVRLGAAATAAISDCIGATAMHSKVFLPEMHSQTLMQLAPAMDALLAVAAQERQAYCAYWQSTIGDAPALLADIGYSGSIQASLARMLQRPLEGGYFALSARANQGLDGQWAAARFHDGRSTDTDADSTILRHDLLLETLLTAPHPQFSHFSSNAGDLQPHYAAAELTSEQWTSIETVHAGALAFVDDVCNAIGRDVAILSFDRTLLQRPLQCLGSGCWDAPWLASLSLDDAFTGRGQVRSR
jgi:FMN phosphatase YigB (HAD superfamily)